MKRLFCLHSRENLLSRFASVTILALAIGTAAFVGYAQQRGWLEGVLDKQIVIENSTA